MTADASVRRLGYQKKRKSVILSVPSFTVLVRRIKTPKMTERLTLKFKLR